MNLREKYKPNVVFDLMKDIIESAYPNLFMRCEAMNTEILISVDSPDAEVYMNSLESIKKDIEILFYREKIILFPFIQSEIDSGKLVEGSLSIKRLDDAILPITQKLKNFLKDLRVHKFEFLGPLSKDIVQQQAKMLQGSWELLLLKKERLYSYINTESSVDNSKSDE